MFVDFPLKDLDLGPMLAHRPAGVLLAMHRYPPPSSTVSVSQRYAIDLRPLRRRGECAAPPVRLSALTAGARGRQNHVGGTSGGHYTAFARNPEDSKWYSFDDARTVSGCNGCARGRREAWCGQGEVNGQRVKTAAAYLLFYRRRR